MKPDETNSLAWGCILLWITNLRKKKIGVHNKLVLTFKSVKGRLEKRVTFAAS